MKTLIKIAIIASIIIAVGSISTLAYLTQTDFFLIPKRNSDQWLNTELRCPENFMIYENSCVPVNSENREVHDASLFFKSVDGSITELCEIDFEEIPEAETCKEIPSYYITEFNEIIIQWDYEDWKTPYPITATNVVDANNQFTLNFYSKISQERNENIFFSPWSISTAFAIAYEGARENTAQEIQNVFGFIEDDNKRRTGFQNIMEKANEKNSEYKFNIANALWLAEGFEPYPQYVSDIQTHYDSEVSTVNFAADATGVINNWVNDKTEEKIKELFTPGSLRADTRLVITNAIYFNGSWTFPFDEKRTSQEEFIVSPSETVQVQMMHQSANFGYYQNELLQLVELPYRGDKMSMLIFLPTSVDGINSLEDSLTIENLSKWKKEMDRKKIRVEIPKFVLEIDYELIEILQQMGMNDAFTPAADFTGISEEDLFIYKAIHKAVVDVNEIGTEAAAATGIAMLQSGPFATVRADHPFIFMIQDTENQNILFIGKVANPSQ